MPASPNHEAVLQRRAGAVDVWLSAVTYWYLTALLAALGFSLGLYFVTPARGVVPERHELLEAFTWQDGKWYKQIATEGYHYDPEARSNTAFFPVYPLLGRAVMVTTGMRAEVALLVVSNVSLLAALGLLAIYVRGHAITECLQQSLNSELPGWVLLAAALFPTGCFFRLTYSESTFLLLTLLAMYGIDRRWRLWLIALVVGLATAARPVGVALLAPFAIHVFRIEATANRKRNWWAVAIPRLLLYLPLACWGLLGFMVYQYQAFGDPLAAFKSHGHWGIRGAFWWDKIAALAAFEPLRSVYDGESRAFWGSFEQHGIPWFSLQFANPLFFLGGIAMLAMGRWRRWLSLEEVSLGGLMLFIPYVSRAYEMGMGSMGRFVAVAFPIYIVLGQVLVCLPGPLRAVIAALFGTFLFTYTALYAARYAIF